MVAHILLELTGFVIFHTEITPFQLRSWYLEKQIIPHVTNKPSLLVTLLSPASVLAVLGARVGWNHSEDFSQAGPCVCPQLLLDQGRTRQLLRVACLLTGTFPWPSLSSMCRELIKPVLFCPPLPCPPVEPQKRNSFPSQGQECRSGIGQPHVLCILSTYTMFVLPRRGLVGPRQSPRSPT